MRARMPLFAGFGSLVMIASLVYLIGCSRCYKLAEPAAHARCMLARKRRLVARLRYRDSERAALKVLAVECTDRLVGRLGWHLDEREAARLARLTVRRHSDRNHFTELGKERLQVLLTRLVRQVSHVDSLRHE